MKLNQLENIHDDLNEAPLGFLKRTGLGIKSKFGSRTARGELSSGKKANEIYNDYLEYVGQFSKTFNSNKPTTDSLISFLGDRLGLDKREFAQLIDKEVQASQPQQQQEPTIDEPEQEPAAQNADDEGNPLKMGNKSNIKTPGDIGNLDSDKTIPGSTKMPTQQSGAEKTATDNSTNTIPSMAPKRKKTGGRQKGGLANTSTAIYQRNRRKMKTGGKGQLELPLGNSMYSEEVQRYRKNFEKINWDLKEDTEYFNALSFMGIMEAELSKNIVNKILGIAAEKVIKNAPKTPQQPQGGQQAQTQSPQQSQVDQQEPDNATADAGTQDSGDEEGKDTRGIFKKFVQGTKAGFQNPDDPNAQMDTDREVAKADDAEKKAIRGNLNYQNISKEFPGIDPVLLRRSFSKSLASKELTRQEQAIMAQAMGELLKKDPEATVKVMNLFKQAREV